MGNATDHYQALLRGKRPVATVPGADTVGSYNSKMISSIPSQANDVGSNIPEGVSTMTLHNRGAPVTGRGAVLEINARDQPMAKRAFRSGSVSESLTLGVASIARRPSVSASSFLPKPASISPSSASRSALSG